MLSLRSTSGVCVDGVNGGPSILTVRIPAWLKTMPGLIAACAAILAAGFACVIYIVKAETSPTNLETSKQIAKLTEDVQNLVEKLSPLPGEISSLDTRVTKLETHWDDLVLRRLGESAKANASSIGKTLRDAQSAKLKLSPQTIQWVGEKLLDVSLMDRTARDAARDCLGYRSFLNVTDDPQPTPATGKSSYREVVKIKPNPDHPELHPAFQVMFAGGYAAPAESARLELLSKPQPAGSEFSFFVINGNVDTIILDGMYMRHVVVRNADLQYDGGPLQLDDVYFVNCLFHSRFKITPTSVKLGQQILRKPSTSFASRPPAQIKRRKKHIRTKGIEK
jgi:hypothetical protein